MMRKGYFLITVFYLPGFCREPCIYLSLPSLGSGFWNSVSPAWHAAWQLSLHPSRGPLLSCPCSAQRQPTSFSTSGQAQCCSSPSATLAEFPWLLSDSGLFPAGLSELQVKPPLQGSALFADAVGSAVESSDALSPPGPGVLCRRAESTSPTKSPRWHFNTQPLPSSSRYIPRQCKVVYNTPQLTSLLRNLPMTTSWKRLAWLSSPSLYYNTCLPPVTQVHCIPA